MNESQTNELADMILDVAISYSNGHETDFRIAAKAAAIFVTQAASNQCDGCRVSAPLTISGNHAMPDGGFMGCTKDRYQVGPALSADFFASRYASPTFDRDTAEAWMLRAQVSLEKGEPGAARIEIEKALNILRPKE